MMRWVVFDDELYAASAEVAYAVEEDNWVFYGSEINHGAKLALMQGKIQK